MERSYDHLPLYDPDRMQELYDESLEARIGLQDELRQMVHENQQLKNRLVADNSSSIRIYNRSKTWSMVINEIFPKYRLKYSFDYHYRDDMSDYDVYNLYCEKTICEKPIEKRYGFLWRKKKTVKCGKVIKKYIGQWRFLLDGSTMFNTSIDVYGSENLPFLHKIVEEMAQNCRTNFTLTLERDAPVFSHSH